MPPPSPAFVPRLRDTEEQRVRETVLQNLAAHPEGYLAEYTATFGNVLNADDAATLFPEYREDPAKHRVAAHPAAVWIRDELFRRVLATPEGRDQIIFTAGGNAAGKSTAIRHTGAAGKALAVMDSTLSNEDHARSLIEQSLASGKAALILYVRRDLEAAFAGMLERAESEGRVVSIEQMLNSDAGAAEVVRTLAAQYADDPRVAFWYLDNFGNEPRLAGIELAAQRDYTEVRKRLYDLLENARESGTIGAVEYKKIGRRG